FILPRYRRVCLTLSICLLTCVPVLVSCMHARTQRVDDLDTDLEDERSEAQLAHAQQLAAEVLRHREHKALSLEAELGAVMAQERGLSLALPVQAQAHATAAEEERVDAGQSLVVLLFLLSSCPPCPDVRIAF